MLGVLDGLASVLLYLTRNAEGITLTRIRLHPLFVALIFFVLGFKSGIIGRLQGALITGLANAPIGLFVGWFCRRRAIRDEEEPHLELR